MSAYDAYDAPPRDRGSRHYYREVRRDARDPRYVDTQESYLRVNPSSRTDLVPRAREDSDLSVEEVRRDFPPPGYGTRDVRRARSAEPGYYEEYYDRRDYDGYRDRRSVKRTDSYYDEEKTRKRVLSNQEKIIAAVVGGVLAAGAKEVWDRREAQKEGREVNRDVLSSAALGAAGAFAGYEGAEFYNKHKNKNDKHAYAGRDGRIEDGYRSDSEEDNRSHKGNKNFLEGALSAAGLGGAIKALTGGKDDRDSRYDDRRSETRSRRGSSASRRSEDTGAKRMQKAAKASLIAGATEAFRVASKPGGWQGEKMKRVLTAAVSAGTIDAAHNPDKDSKRHLVESVIGGLIGNRVLNGPRRDIEEDKRTGRSRSRSRARSEGGGNNHLAALAATGLGALGAKKLLDKRSESRSRRGSPDSYGSYDSRDGSPRRRQRSRSRSIVDGARRSLAKLGIGHGPDDDYEDSRSSRRRDDDDYTSRGYMRGGRGDDDYDDDRSTQGGRRRNRSRQRSGRSSSASSSDLGDSEEDEKQARNMRDRKHRHHHH